MLVGLCQQPAANAEEDQWTLYIDGSSNQKGA